MVKKLVSPTIFVLLQLPALGLLSGCTNVDEKLVSEQTTEADFTFSFDDAAVALPSPASVKLGPDGRFDSRFQGNINYLRYQHDYYGQEMLEAFAMRHYSPGKLLERVWDGEYAGKWLDGYMGIKLPMDRELNHWEKAWDIWNQWYALTGLLTHYELRDRRASLEAASRVGEWIVTTFRPIKDKNSLFFEGEVDGFTKVAVIKQLVRLYRHTGNEDLLEFVGQVIQHYPPILRQHRYWYHHIHPFNKCSRVVNPTWFIPICSALFWVV